MVVHGETFGGVHNQALQLAAGWRAPGLDLVVCLPETARSHAGAQLERAGLRVLYVPLERPRRGMGPLQLLSLARAYGRQVLRLASVIRTERPDVVQTHGLQHL